MGVVFQCLISDKCEWRRYIERETVVSILLYLCVAPHCSVLWDQFQCVRVTTACSFLCYLCPTDWLIPNCAVARVPPFGWAQTCERDPSRPGTLYAHPYDNFDLNALRSTFSVTIYSVTHQRLSIMRFYTDLLSTVVNNDHTPPTEILAICVIRCGAICNGGPTQQ